MASVHSHNPFHQDTPSPQDLDAAKKSKTTVYVVSRSGLWAVAPDGTVSKPYDYPEDIRNKKKKASTK
jgi:hypothetical protein